MPDITMCRDKECPACRFCYRFTAKAHNYRQSFFSETPRNINSDVCEYFIPNEIKNKRNIVDLEK